MQDAKRMDTQEHRQAEAKVAELTKTRESYEKQLKLLKEKQQQLVITSPIDGQINTWQLRELLLHRPVRQGQVLMNVADTGGEWEAELDMPENRMGHVATARKQLRPDLPVRFFVATSPGDEHHGTVVTRHHDHQAPDRSVGRDHGHDPRGLRQGTAKAVRPAPRRNGDRQGQLWPRFGGLQILASGICLDLEDVVPVFLTFDELKSRHRAKCEFRSTS